MFPDALNTLLAIPANTLLGSRDAQLRPALHRCFGCKRLDDGTIAMFVTHPGNLADNVADNGELALNINNYATLETFQLKGKCVSLREPVDADLAFFTDYKAGLIDAIAALGYPRELLEAFIQPPKVIAALEVREIFIQTPGPEAGKRIYPEVTP